MAAYMRGGHLSLRAVERSDLEAIHAWENDPAMWLVGHTAQPISRDTVSAFIEDSHHCIYTDRQLKLMAELHDGTLVGALDLYDFDPRHRRAAVGIVIAQQHREKGCAAEALGLLCDYGRDVLNLHQLWCQVPMGNTASLSLFEKAGFERSGILRDWLLTANRMEDAVQFQRIL